MRFSTDELPTLERLEMWRDVISRKLLHLTIDPLSDRPFRAKASLRSLPGLRIGTGMIGAALHQRTRTIIADDNDDIALLVNLSGPFLIHGRHAELQLGPGDACLVDCSEAGAFVRTEPGSLLCVRLPRAALGGLAGRLDDAIGLLIPSQTEPLSLLAAYLGLLHDGAPIVLSPASSRVVVDHVADLMALIVGAGPDATAQAASRGVRAARLGTIKAQIRERLSAVDLSIEDIAASQRVSARYVRKLFEGEGTSFSAYVAGERLARAHAMLASPRFGDLQIATIAYDVGFGDLSYFNRQFRRRFQATPSDVRAEARSAWGASPEAGSSPVKSA